MVSFATVRFACAIHQRKVPVFVAIVPELASLLELTMYCAEFAFSPQKEHIKMIIKSLSMGYIGTLSYVTVEVIFYFIRITESVERCG